MSVLTTLPTPVVQMSLVEKIVEIEQNQAYIQQMVTQQTAGELLKAQRERVSGMETAKRGKKIRDRESGGERREQCFGQAQPDAPDEAKDDKLETNPHKPNPWAGHIVNMKI